MTKTNNQSAYNLDDGKWVINLVLLIDKTIIDKQN